MVGFIIAYYLPVISNHFLTKKLTIKTPYAFLNY